MPEIGDIKSGGKAIQRHIYLACPQCGKERWVALPSTKRPDYTGLCHQCNASVRGGNRMKKGYRGKHSDGYVVIKLQPDDFLYPMAGRDGYVFEHRLVVARALGRCLHSWEIVHHKKGYARDDNRYPETLQLMSDLGHKQLSLLEAFINKLQRQIEALKAENRRLKNGQ